jgi:lipoprotein-anchoring transpeptidase ErfK/SrfK
MITRRKLITTGFGVAAGLATASCTSEALAPSKMSSSQPAPSPSATASLHPVSVTVTPSANSKSVSPREPVVVSVNGGTLRSVSVTSAGQTVAGTSSDQQNWRSTGALAYGKTYTVTVSAADDSGVVTQKTSTFRTVTPSAVATISFQANALSSLNAGGTYGVGQPVVVNFSETIKDRTAAEKAMHVATTPAVVGRWRWIDGQNAHWRPEKYWAPGTQITVRIDLFGANLGNGVYGASARTHFSIGPSRIAIADAKSHRMKVYIDGKMVRDIPVSMGKGGVVKGSQGETIDFWTRSGPHVMLTKDATFQMTSSSFGISNPKDPNYYDERITLCCRISYSGEFVHMADWNIPAQGHVNTSHGCINVGPANARWFYDTFQPGDVVEVTNTPMQLSLTDGLGDWTVPWNKW